MKIVRDNSSQKISIMWHRRDLRVYDNKALFYALEESITNNTPILPIFIFDPAFFKEENRNTCDDRIIFLCESVQALKEKYKTFGVDMKIVYGDSNQVLQTLQKKLNATIFCNNDTNMHEGFLRDSKLKSLHIQQFDNDAILRDSQNSRVSWSTHAQQYFSSDIFDTITQLKKIQQLEQLIQEQKENLNELLNFSQLDITEIEPNFILQTYKLKKQKKFNQLGGEEEAQKQLQFFLKHIEKYPSSISKPYKAQFFCSRLSAYFSLGCISLKHVYNEVEHLEHINRRTKQFYQTRLFWNQHFTQKLEDFKELPQKAVNPVLRKINEENYNEEFISRYKNAQTGYPLVDASITALVQTGWINFRMRAMIASFFCFILHQSWKIGADFMAYHLMDCDMAINYAQWQMQAGVVGVHPLRIYNVTKQIYDNDNELQFIKQQLPIFKDVKEIEYIAEPWKYQQELYKKYNISLGRDYPLLIVNFDEEAKITREWFKERMPDIRKALEIPEVKKNASLSKKRAARSSSSSKKKSSTQLKKDDKKKESKEKSLLDF
ncbi:MAG: deoxyribodipyrimidine photo-lyase [Nanoarchaeota archaeon]|nr:deoxyribodipyrimidine photo-lyase [Nanoarchaeota archaeon]